MCDLLLYFKYVRHAKGKRKQILCKRSVFLKHLLCVEQFYHHIRVPACSADKDRLLIPKWGGVKCSNNHRPYLSTWSQCRKKEEISQNRDANCKYNLYHVDSTQIYVLSEWYCKTLLILNTLLKKKKVDWRWRFMRNVSPKFITSVSTMSAVSTHVMCARLWHSLPTLSQSNTHTHTYTHLRLPFIIML